jgi:hypothetical protein
MWLLERFLERCLRKLADDLGPAAEIGLFLTAGLSLLIGGPWYMGRENEKRIKAERKPKYVWLEIAIILVGGAVFTAVGGLSAAIRRLGFKRASPFRAQAFGLHGAGGWDEERCPIMPAPQLARPCTFALERFFDPRVPKC